MGLRQLVKNTMMEGDTAVFFVKNQARRRIVKKILAGLPNVNCVVGTRFGGSCDHASVVFIEGTYPRDITKEMKLVASSINGRGSLIMTLLGPTPKP
jgi:hypothetical protein